MAAVGGLWAKKEKKSQKINTELIRRRRKSKMEDSTPVLKLKVKRDFTQHLQQWPLQISTPMSLSSGTWMKKIIAMMIIKYKMKCGGKKVARVKKKMFCWRLEIICAVQCNSVWPNGDCWVMAPLSARAISCNQTSSVIIRPVKDI